MRIGEWVTLPTETPGELVSVEVIDQTEEGRWTGRTQDGVVYDVIDTEVEPC